MAKRGYKTGSFEERFWGRVRKTDSCWIWAGLRNDAGYGRIVSVKFKTDRAHRVSWILHNGPIPEGMCVCHSCDNPPCVNPDHLFLGTRRDNVEDTVSKGRQKTSARVSADQDVEIKRRYAAGETQKALAIEFGYASEASIGRIIKDLTSRGRSMKRVVVCDHCGEKIQEKVT